MTRDNFVKYLAQLYQLETDDARVKQAATMAVPIFTGKKPWSFCRQTETLTTDANGVITFSDDFDGTITMREQTSTSGGWIKVWSEEKFDYELPRLDNLSGSYAAVCKVYKSDGTWYGQMAPPVSSQSIYVTYKRKITNISEIDESVLDGVIAVAHTLLIRPNEPGYLEAQTVMKQKIKDLWKTDKQVWSEIFKTIDEGNVREYVRWWGVWQW